MFINDLNIPVKIDPDDFQLILEAIMQYSRDGIFVTDDEGNIVMLNRASEEMNDILASDVLGRNVGELLKEGYYDRSVTRQVIKHKKAVSLIHTTHNRKKVLATGIPIFDDTGRLRFVFVNDRDITYLKRLAETLEADDASSDRYRIDFSNISRTLTELQEYVIESPAMMDIIKAVVQASKFDVTVVLRGGSGVGKSMIAKLIHRLSDRKNGPFISVNCSVIAETLLESELFGYEKGAFTGANTQGKTGYFELAHNGTLFLDEVGELPLNLQVKLLKFLESFEIVRVGDVRTRKIDTRIIAATNQDLETMVNNGTFRSDLYFRLNVVPIHIPPLAERREEILPMVRFFLKRFNQQFNVNKTISDTALAALTACDFPGNVRELENLIKRLVTMTEDDVIRFRDLPQEYARSGNGETGFPKDEIEHYKSEIRRLELDVIKNAVKTYGSQRKAAKALGMDQSTLSRKLRGEKIPKLIH